MYTLCRRGCSKKQCNNPVGLDRVFCTIHNVTTCDYIVNKNKKNEYTCLKAAKIGGKCLSHIKENIPTYYCIYKINKKTSGIEICNSKITNPHEQQYCKKHVKKFLIEKQNQFADCHETQINFNPCSPCLFNPCSPCLLDDEELPTNQNEAREELPTNQNEAREELPVTQEEACEELPATQEEACEELPATQEDDTLGFDCGRMSCPDSPT